MHQKAKRRRWLLVPMLPASVLLSHLASRVVEHARAIGGNCDGQRSLQRGRAQSHACKGRLEQSEAILVQGPGGGDPLISAEAGGWGFLRPWPPDRSRAPRWL
eukprot:9029977-Pyramimonas_sp.AAC.1